MSELGRGWWIEPLANRFCASFILKTAIEPVARRTRALKMREKIEKYSAAVAHRYGEERFFDFVVQIRWHSHSQ